MNLLKGLEEIFNQDASDRTGKIMRLEGDVGKYLGEILILSMKLVPFNSSLT